MMNTRFLQVRQVRLPHEFIDSIYEFFRASGGDGFESVVLLAGELNEDIFLVSHLLFPEQTIFKTSSGLGYHVRGEELERINTWLYKNSKTLIAQVHSHPEEAFHSPVDDEFAIVTETGSLSIVIPDFGNSDENLSESAVFRLKGEDWNELTRDEISLLIKIID
jgi:hypothetical protein